MSNGITFVFGANTGMRILQIANTDLNNDKMIMARQKDKKKKV